MPTNKECIDYQQEIYRHIGCRVKRWIFVLVVVAAGSMFVLIGRAVWATTENANATEIRRQLHEQASDKAQEVRDKTQAKEYGELREAIRDINKKIDAVLDRIHSVP